MGATAFTVDFELTVDRPGLDIEEIVKVEGQPFTAETRADGVTFVGAAPIMGLTQADAERAFRTKLEEGAANAGYGVVSLDIVGLRPTAFSG